MNFLEKADGRDTEKYNNEIQQGTDVSQAERKERIGGGGWRDCCERVWDDSSISEINVDYSTNRKISVRERLFLA